VIASPSLAAQRSITFAMRSEESHAVVFQRQVELRRAGITPSASASTELTIDPVQILPLGAEDLKPHDLEHIVNREILVHPRLQNLQ